MNFGFRAIFSCFSFCLFLSICLVMLDVKWRELAPSNSVSLEVLESSRSFETSSANGLKGTPEFHRFTSTYSFTDVYLGVYFLSHYGFRARPINGELIGFMCRELTGPKKCGPLGQLEAALQKTEFENYVIEKVLFLGFLLIFRWFST